MPVADFKKMITELFDETLKRTASDLHLAVDRRPTVRVDSDLIPLEKYPVLDADGVRALVQEFTTEEQRQGLEEDRDVDFAYTYKEEARFRVNIFYQQGALAAALRLLPAKIQTLQELNLPPVLHEFGRLKQGFVLIVGPAGHGKSTAMAAIVDEINHSRRNHIVTIEDPVEYLFEQDNCIIAQREVGHDTTGFARALRAALRQDPDVVVVGEMRDSETTATALTASETGHLVFATVHTNDAAQTIDRIIDSFPPAQQQQVRIQLAGSLQGIISLRLIPRVEGGRIPATEVLIVDTAVRNLIRENKTHQIGLVVETNADAGMISLNRSLASLVQRGEISLENAELYSSNAEELRLLVG